MRFRLSMLSCVIACPLAGVTQAAEGPAFQVTVQQTPNIYTATPASSSVPGFKPHINFPYMKARADGTLEVNFTVGQTHGVGVFGLRGYSYDGGLTWSGFTSAPPSSPNSSIVRPAGQTSYGVSTAFTNAAGQTSWNNTRYFSSNGGTSWSFDTANFNSNGVTYVSAYNNLGDIVQSGSTLFTTVYCQRPGVSTLETVLFASQNNGANWVRRSTIASYTPDPKVGMASEGPSESSVVRLNNGNLLSVFRTGQPFPSTDIKLTTQPLMWAMSADDGYTWSTPKTLGVSGVFPLLRKMDDGAVALTYGRYGAKVMFADETGLRWTTPTVIYNGPGSGHTEIRKANNGSYVFVYDQSSFYPPSWDASPPAGYVYNNDQSANLKAAILNITRTTPQDAYKWASEYHGDVAPTSLPQPWSISQAGTSSTYFWADQGQDYIRINTGTSGVSATQHYTLPASGTAWGAMKFSEGVVIEMRGRVGPDGAGEGAADLLAGDGSSGYALLQLTSSSVLLEGTGGNGQQAAYLSSSNPGFSTKDWHDYRMVIAPDPAQGGAIFAKVYLDGNYASPILVNTLATSGLDLLRFGDEIGTSNGIFDVDFLRFASLVNKWTGDSNGDWNDSSRWTASVPNAIDATANFTDAINSPSTVNVAAPVTVGHIKFDNLNRYTLAGSGTITLQTSNGAADIQLTSGNHSILAPLNLQSSTTITGAGALNTASITNAATLNLQTDLSGGAIDGNGSVVVQLGKSLQADRVRQSVLTVNGTAAIRSGRSSNKTSIVSSLSLGNNGVLDLGDNDLIVNYSGASPMDEIRASIVSGYASGSWNGTGINSSVAAAQTSSIMALGYAEAGALGVGSFSGQIVDDTSVLVRYVYAGDANLDGKVSTTDFNLLAGNFSASNSDWVDGDFNYDGTVDALDFNVLAGNYGQVMASASVGTLVPEPLISPLVLAVLGLHHRRRPSRHWFSLAS